MRRKTQRAVVHLSIFSFILFLLLYLNRPLSNTSFAWTTIRYKSRASSLPETRGICPGLAETSKPALVVSRVAADDDQSWLNGLADLYHICVYTADAPTDAKSTHLQVPANRGHEAMGYLTFLIDNYENIPKAGVVFVHGSRFAWHNDHPEYDNAALLAKLDIPAALAQWGYHNLRCDWSASTCPLSSAPQSSLETSLMSILQPWDARIVSDNALPGTLATLFGGEDSAGMAGQLYVGRTEAVRSQCCAQFVVARDNIWQHSRDEYVALRQWLLDGSTQSGNHENAAPLDDAVAGRILSYVWHILFLKQGRLNAIDLGQLNSQACPRADDCYCRLYGRCNLEGCTNPGSCRGQYQVPKGFRLPPNWAADHS
jgi:hypothetical protein